MGGSSNEGAKKLQKQQLALEQQQYQQQKQIANQKAANLARVRQQQLQARFGGGFGSQTGTSLASLGGGNQKLGQ